MFYLYLKRVIDISYVITDPSKYNTGNIKQEEDRLKEVLIGCCILLSIVIYL